MSSATSSPTGKAWLNTCGSARLLMRHERRSLEVQWSDEIDGHVLLDQDDFLDKAAFVGSLEHDDVVEAPGQDFHPQNTKDREHRRQLLAGECSNFPDKTIKVVIHHDAARSAAFGTSAVGDSVYTDGAAIMVTAGVSKHPRWKRPLG